MLYFTDEKKEEDCWETEDSFYQFWKILTSYTDVKNVVVDQVRYRNIDCKYSEWVLKEAKVKKKIKRYLNSRKFIKMM